MSFAPEHPRLIAVPESIPRRGGVLRRWLGLFMLWCMGFRVSGTLPDARKLIVVVAPHTSNWDGVVALGAIFGLRLDLKFMAKHTLFVGPFGPFVRWLGGIAINREQAGDVVGESARQLKEREGLLLAMAPEGTRKGADHWKTGFYRISERSGVPILPVAFDYARKEIRVMPPVTASGDLEGDMEKLLEQFRDAAPRNPKWLSKPLRERRGL